MDIKNLEDLRNAYPEFVAQIENAAKDGVQNQGAEAERARIKAIEEIEASIADKALVNEAKYGENPMTAEQLALKAMQAQAKIGATMLNHMEADTQQSGVDGVEATPNSGAEGGADDAEAELSELANIYKTFKGGK